MKNITKFLLVLVSSVSLSFASFAGELSVTGSAKASYSIGGTDDSTDKGIGISNELTFGASGELDNGFTWTYAMELDGNDGGAHDNDDTQLVIGMNELGTIGFFDSEGGLSKELGYGIGALGTGSDYAGTMTTQYGLDVSNSPNVQYHTPADILPFGFAAKVGYAPNTADGDNNSFKSTGGVNPDSLSGSSLTHYQVTAAPIAGLAIGIDYAEGADTTAGIKQDPSSGNYYAQYAFANVKVGYNMGFYEPGLIAKDTAVTKYENTALGIEVAINDQLSLSYSEEKSEAETSAVIASGASTRAKTHVEAEGEAVQIAYVLGGATVGVAVLETTNADYTAGKDEKVTMFSLAMEF
jgi:hypothetical protein